jgi:hypothetical protein
MFHNKGTFENDKKSLKEFESWPEIVLEPQVLYA